MHVFQRVNLDNVQIDPGHGHLLPTVRFLRTCFRANNPHAHFLLGMHLYDASCRGQMEATYMVGMILLSRGDIFHYTAIDILNDFKRSNQNWDIPLSRNKVEVRLA